MGNKASVATIAVSFDYAETAPGDVVTGKVFLSVSQAEVDCTSIGCRVFGQEHTIVHYTTHSGSGKNRQTHHHTARETRNFVDLPFRLQHFPTGKVSAGQYEYPFQFTIPYGCPASMTVEAGRNRCCIQYYMEVWLDRTGMMKWDIRNKQLFTVVTHPPSNAKTPIYMEPSAQGMRTMGCMYRGKVMVGGMVENSTLVAGETTVVKYAVQNQSSLGLKAVEVSLDEIVNFHARGHSHGRMTKLFHTRLTGNDSHLDLSPLKGNPMDDDQALRAMNEVLSSDTTNLQVTVPLTARSNFGGALISVRHELTIKVCTPFGTSNPQVTRPVYVFSRGAPIVPNQEDGFAPPPALPAGWSPVVAQAVVLPAMARTASTLYEEENDQHAQQVYATAVAAGGVVAVAQPLSNFNQLLQVLAQSFDPIAELNRFLKEGGDVNALQDEDYYKLFASIRDVFDQQRAADLLAAHLSSISCAKVGQAAAAANQMVRREVVEKLLSVQPLVDKQNAALVNKHLSAFEAMTVEKYFR